MRPGWQPFTFHLTPLLVHSPFSEILGVDGSQNTDILDLKKRIGAIYRTFSNTLQSLEQLSTTEQ